MRFLIIVTSLIAPALGATPNARAQSIPVDSGRPVLVVLRAGPQIEGMLVRQTPERLIIRVAEGDTPFLVRDVEKVVSPVQVHTLSLAAKGLGFGILGGAIVGGAAAAIAMNSCTGDTCRMDILAGPAAAVLGGIAGLIVGSMRTRTEWRPVWSAPAATP